jgi:hypothetical protein
VPDVADTVAKVIRSSQQRLSICIKPALGGSVLLLLLPLTSFFGSALLFVALCVISLSLLIKSQRL